MWASDNATNEYNHAVCPVPGSHSDTALLETNKHPIYVSTTICKTSTCRENFKSIQSNRIQLWRCTIVANDIWAVRFIFIPPTNERTRSSVFDIVHSLNTRYTKLGVQVPRGVSEASKAMRSNPYIKNISPKNLEDSFVQFSTEMCRLAENVKLFSCLNFNLKFIIAFPGPKPNTSQVNAI